MIREGGYNCKHLNCHNIVYFIVRDIILYEEIYYTNVGNFKRYYIILYILPILYYNIIIVRYNTVAP